MEQSDSIEEHGATGLGGTDERRRRAKRLRRYGAGVLLASTAGLAGFGALAGAATKGSTITKSTSSSSGSTTAPAGRGPGGPGGGTLTVTSVSPTSLVGTTLDGTSVTFTLTSSTTYTKDGATDTESDLAVGDHVMVMPTRPSSSFSSSSTASTTKIAASVNIVSPSLGGTVVSTSGSGNDLTVVLEDQEGFYRTIVTSDSTTYTDDGSTVTSPSITTGAFISALGTIASDHETLDATSVSIGKPTAPSGSSGGSAGGPAGGPGGFGGPGGGPGGF